MIVINKLVKYYKVGHKDRFKALNNINLTFKSGELVSVLGESGSGKSTLMNIIGGLDSDFEGDVLVDGKQLRHLKESELDQYRKNKIGFIFQSFNLISHLRVIDNVAIALTLSNVPRREKQARAALMLKKVGLEKHMYKKPNQLSGGQKQRVAIARALINDPDIILADEPTGALDSKTSDQVLKIIQEIAASSKLIIMVTHSQRVAAISSRVISISDGQIVSDQINENNPINDKQIIGTTKLKQNLPFVSAIKLAINNMYEKWLRNLLVALGSSIGIMSVILMLSIGTGVENYITNQMYANVNPKVIEVNKKADTSTNKMDRPIDFMEPKPTFTEQDINKLSKIKHVDKVEKGYTEFNAMNKIIYGDKQTKVSYLVSTSSIFTKSSIKTGKMPGANEIAIDNLIVEQLGVTDKEVIGKTVRLKLSIDEQDKFYNFVVRGVYDNTSTANQGITQGIVTYETMERLYQDSKLSLKPNTVYLVATDKDYANDIKEEIQKLGFEGSILERMVKIFTDMLGVVTWILSAIAGISLFVSSIMILVVLYISVVERTREIGVLKAIGARRKDIMRIFVSEAFLLGVSGGLIGVVGALFIAMIINLVTKMYFDIEAVVVSLNFMWFGFIISILISIIAGLIPAAKAAKLDPIESLRHE